MEPVVRRIRPEEASAFRQSVMIPFLEPYAGDPDQVADFELWASKSELDRAWVADTGDRFVGNACIYSLDVTLPAPPGEPCPTIPMAGVSAVGVHPTHRRQGLLRKLITAMHEDARESVFLCSAKQRVEMLLVRVHAAVGDQAKQVQLATALLRLLHGLHNGRHALERVGRNQRVGSGRAFIVS